VRRQSSAASRLRRRQSGPIGVFDLHVHRAGSIEYVVASVRPADRAAVTRSSASAISGSPASIRIVAGRCERLAWKPAGSLGGLRLGGVRQGELTSPDMEWSRAIFLFFARRGSSPVATGSPAAARRSASQNRIASPAGWGRNADAETPASDELARLPRAPARWASAVAWRHASSPRSRPPVGEDDRARTTAGRGHRSSPRAPAAPRRDEPRARGVRRGLRLERTFSRSTSRARRSRASGDKEIDESRHARKRHQERAGLERAAQRSGAARRAPHRICSSSDAAC